MSDRSKLLRMEIFNLGCIGPEGLSIGLNDIVCLVGRNNAGKSTILRAYELALLPSMMTSEDRCKWAPDGAETQVILDVHIPDGIENVDVKWKEPDDGLLRVRSRWTWGSDMKHVRKTWDPSLKEWAEEGKAGGADNVFKGRLPKPMRIGSLQDTGKMDEVFMALIIDPWIKQIKQYESDPNSKISKAITNLIKSVGAPTKDYQDIINNAAEDVTKGLQDIFPALKVYIDVKLDSPKPDFLKGLLTSGSGVRVEDGGFDTKISQQGTGARRALFWTLLRVNNIIQRKNEEEKKQKEYFEKLKKDKDKIEQKAKRTAGDNEKLEVLKAQIEKGWDLSSEDSTEMAFPGYILLIDEPENALHPIAARSAQKALYELAESHDWQVMVTTHSPYFVNPLADHTTIVRLERENKPNSPISPKMYRTEKANFSEEDKSRLQALQKMDTGLSEIFFGSYPILVEGDTENAAFIAAVLEDDPGLSEKVIIVKSLGKATFLPLIKILHHFKVGFGILHDCDSPYTKEGENNGMWTINTRISEELDTCRESGLIVRHRISIPDFERRLGGEELGKDKPFSAYSLLKRDAEKREEIRNLLTELMESEQHRPFKDEEIAQAGGYEILLKKTILEWADTHGNSSDPKFSGVNRD